MGRLDYATREIRTSFLRNASTTLTFSGEMRDRRRVASPGTGRVQMARTPLLRAFRGLADEHRAPEALGLAPAELRGQAVSRRESPKAAGVAGAGLAALPVVLAPRARSAAGP